MDRGTRRRNDLRRVRRSLCVSVSDGGSAYEGRREVEGRGEGDDDDDGRGVDGVGAGLMLRVCGGPSLKRASFASRGSAGGVRVVDPPTASPSRSTAGPRSAPGPLDDAAGGLLDACWSNSSARPCAELSAGGRGAAGADGEGSESAGGAGGSCGVGALIQRDVVGVEDRVELLKGGRRACRGRGTRSTSERGPRTTRRQWGRLLDPSARPLVRSRRRFRALLDLV